MVIVMQSMNTIHYVHKPQMESAPKLQDCMIRIQHHLKFQLQENL